MDQELKHQYPLTSAEQSYYNDKLCRSQVPLLSNNGLHVWSQVKRSAYLNAWAIGT